MTNTSKELREQILVEFKQVYKLAPADHTENCTNVVMAMVEAWHAQQLNTAVVEAKNEQTFKVVQLLVKSGSISDSAASFTIATLKQQLKEGK